MARTHLAVPIDVVRRFDPQQTRIELESDQLLGDGSFGDEERLRSRIEGVESVFEDRTDNALREVREGSVGRPATYEHHDNKYWKHNPASVYLNNRNILPLDPQAGDALEIRVGIDRWRDITGQEGQRWTADYKMGKLEIFAKTRTLRGYQNLRDNRFVRITYRHGSLGGDRNEGGETTLSSALSLPGADPETGVAVDTTVGVEDAARLPPDGGTMLLGGEEYVDVQAVNPETNEVTLRRRGLRGTATAQHDMGTRLHYCPMNVREGIASMAARELVLFDDWADRMTDESDRNVPSQQKLDNWKAAFDAVVGRHAEGGYY